MAVGTGGGGQGGGNFPPNILPNKKMSLKIVRYK